MGSYFSFHSKIGRLEFALTTIGVGFLSSCITACFETTYYDPYTESILVSPLDPLTDIVLLLLLVASIYWQVLTFCKRLNDVNRSRWMILWSLIPLANFVLWLYLCFKTGVEACPPSMRKPIQENSSIQTQTFEDKFKNDDSLETKAPQPNFDRMVADLERLGEMHQKGLLTDDEFQTLKKKILNQ